MNRYKSREWKILESLQNNNYPDQDILTITGFMDHEEFIQYVNNKLMSCMEKETQQHIEEMMRG